MSDTMRTSIAGKAGVEEEEEEGTVVGNGATISSSSYPVLSLCSAIALTVTVTGSMILNIMNVQGALISLPTIGQDLHIEISNYQWLISAYALTFGSLLLLFGRLSDLYGCKKVFLSGMSWGAIWSIAVALAPSEITVDIFRALQGIGAAAAIPASLGILASSFEPSRRKSIAFATYSAGAPLGSSLGSIFAGVASQYATWRVLFYLSAGGSAIVILSAWFVVPNDPVREVKKGENRSVDFIGAAMISVGLLLLTFSLAGGEGASDGWRTPYIPIFLVLGVGLVITFWFWESRLEHSTSPTATVPLMKTSLWYKGKFAIMQLMATLAWSAFASFLFFATQYYQTYLLLSPIQATLRFLTCAIVGVAINVVVAVISSRVSAYPLMVLGSLGIALAPFLFAVQSYSSYEGYWAFEFPAMALSVFGADFIFSLGIMYVSKIAASDEQALAGGVFNSTTQIGTAIGLAIMTIVQNTVTQKETIRLGFEYSADSRSLPPQAILKGLQAAFYACAGFGFVAFLIAVVFLRDIGIVGDRDIVVAPKLDEEDSDKTNGKSDDSVI